MFKNFTNSSKLFAPEAIVECSVLKKIGVYCIILFIISFTSNLAVIIVFIKNKNHLLNGVNILILSLTILNLIGTLIELPLVITSAFYCK